MKMLPYSGGPQVSREHHFSYACCCPHLLHMRVWHQQPCAGGVWGLSFTFGVYKNTLFLTYQTGEAKQTANIQRLQHLSNEQPG